MLLISEKERKEIAKDFSFKPEGANIPTKIADVTTLAENLQKERKREKKAMIIEISPIIKRVKRDTSIGITNVKDANNNVVYGIFTGLDDYRNITWARIHMDNGITLNLENIEDAKRWIVIRMHAKIKGSPFESDPLFEVNDPSIEAQKMVQRVTKTEKLFDLIRRMSGSEMVDTLRYLGEEVNEYSTLKIVKSKLYEQVLTKTDHVYEKMSSKQRGIEAKILAAVEYSIIEYNPENGYIYNQVPLGISMNDVINHFESNKIVKDSILSEVSKSDVVSHNIQTEFENISEEDKKSEIF